MPLNEHSFGHGDICYWCGIDYDQQDTQPCNESLRKHPSQEVMDEISRKEKIADKITALVLDWTYSVISFDSLLHQISEMEPKPIKPISMIIWCSYCFKQHIDRGEWATKLHKTHRCEYCNKDFKIARVPTVGVEDI